MWVSLTIDDDVALVRLDRPAALNAMTAEFGDEFRAAVESAVGAGVRAIVVAGSDRAFSVGADRAVFTQPSAPRTAPSGWLCLRDIGVPSIAAVSGHAIGGGFELALTCDLIIADPSARFSLPEVSLGIIPGMGGVQGVARAGGTLVARDMVLTGRVVGAAEAATLGLISRVTEPGALVATALEAARRIAQQPVAAVAAAREAVTLVDLPLPNALRAEQALLAQLRTGSARPQ
ncbi:enoyl-CoA hydratase/isomerase family protein [Microbacterium sp. YY-03]|uniref:enoyl-CoA hydratase/isomerase family protein n=1 Tax=Microbacterium sp. YY-03 TaxID=3421636 RepID=UPI003D183B72